MKEYLVEVTKVTRRWVKAVDEESAEEIAENMEEEIKLELGYELLSLVNKEHGTLLDGITKLRELHPEIPKIRIMDNMNFVLGGSAVSYMNRVFDRRAMNSEYYIDLERSQLCI